MSPTKTMCRYNLDNAIKNIGCSISGEVLNLGAGKSSYYHEYFPNAKMTTADCDETTSPDIVFDANKPFPIESNLYDAVISFNVIEHITNYDNYLKEIRRILKPGGKAIISVVFIHPFHGFSYLDSWRFSHQGTAYIFKNANLKIKSIKRIGGRFSVVLDAVSNSLPFGDVLRYLLRGITIYADENLLSKTDRRIGKIYYQTMLVEAEK